MNIPNKIYCKVEQLPFMHRAIVLALITEYMETGTINPEAQGAPLEFFMEVKAELDGVLKKRAYARQYRERKKAQAASAKEKSTARVAPKETDPKITKTADEPAEPKRIFRDNGNLTRRKRRKLEKRGFIIV